ncbi:cache domain-containing protein [Ideonella sp. DXS22W]|uniref:histidine kinase n=1 Tax=Pseudaquabacterium inlustre TaxID=2984192 RepID=A0ABU9CAD1_9BURK
MGRGLIAAPWRDFGAWPIRRKLQALALLPLLGVLPLLGLVLLAWGDAAVDRLLVTKARSDLAVAQGYFERVQGEVAASTRAVAESQALHEVLRGVLRGALQPAPVSDAAVRALLLRIQAREGLDFINLRHPDGRLWVGDGEADGGSGREAAAPALPPADERVQASVAILSPTEQGLLPLALRQRVAVGLLSTRAAQPSDRQVEDRAMVLRALAPVRDAQGQVLAWVQAGLLLNRNLPFIDHINAIVYPEGALPFGSQGTATLFLDDVRISTNVRLFGDGQGQGGEARAIGTRVSQAVREAVLERGNLWLGRAFVVSDWYVSAYQPLHDAQGRRVGMLYVGFLERPFTWLKWGVLAGIGAVFFGVMIAAAAASARLARRIFRPIEQMDRTMQQVEAGTLGARVGDVDSGDELGALAGHLDRLLETLAERNAQLQRWNAELDAKVTERTAALAAAQQQLLRSEKMATVGQLTASIAHEVNNPIAVIQGNLDLARELLGPDARKVADELRLADEQIERMRLIVTQLLQFARPNEYAGYVEAVDPARAIDDSLVLVSHLLASSRIAVQRHFETTRPAGINRQELQQVLVNLMVNAIQAMAGGGTLTLATRDWADDQGRPGVLLEVADTGPGLDEGLLRELFQPFVTRKKDGTGLGLWISRGIVERYGGDIRAANRAEGGAAMQVLLLTEGGRPQP